MRFKVDENLPAEIVQLLRNNGHDADSIMEEGLTGAQYPRIANETKSTQRAIVTLDRGFGNIRAYPPTEYPGIIVLRPERVRQANRRCFGEEITTLTGQATVDGQAVDRRARSHKSPVTRRRRRIINRSEDRRSLLMGDSKSASELRIRDLLERLKNSNKTARRRAASELGKLDAEAV